MEQSKVLEGNKIIAVFMGGELSDRFIAPIKVIKINHEDYYSYGCLPEDLKYHLSWDWIMPVLEKINEITHKGFPIVVTVHAGGGVWIGVNPSNAAGNKYEGKREIVNTMNDNYFNDFPEAVKVTPNESAFNAVVQFIQWYTTTESGKQ